MPRSLGFLETFPVLSALPTSSGSGRVVTLTTDGRPYFDHSTGWQRMDVQASAAPPAVVTSITGAYTVLAGDSVILANSTTAAFIVTLPTAVGATGRAYTLKKLDASLNAVTLATTSSQTIDGGATAVLSTQYLSLTVISDGANWQVV